MANSSGDTDITLLNQINTVLVTVTGAARTSNLALKHTNMIVGATTRLSFALPATSGITLNIRDDSSTGTVLGSFLTDGEQRSAVADLVYNGTTWLLTAAAIPAL